MNDDAERRISCSFNKNRQISRLLQSVRFIPSQHENCQGKTRSDDKKRAVRHSL